MANITIGIAAFFLVAITISSVIESNIWWIRIWDFPRFMIACLALITFVCAIIFMSGPARWVVPLTMVAVMGWQAYRIFPYTPFAAKEVEFATLDAQDTDKQCFKILSFNVLQDNRNYQATIDMLEREDPDVILLMETDQKWIDAVAPAMEKYGFRETVPLDNLYGLAFYTRLNVTRSEVRYIADTGTPSIFVWMETRNGDAFHFIGLHPRPPMPGQDTEDRDGEIAIAAKLAAEENVPVLAMGDFNDVAWSKTSQTFKRIGGYVDPRIGRGFYATFPAYWPIFRWPLDHLFITPDVAITSIDVLENTGSDHLPVTAQFCIAPQLADRLNDTPEPADTEDRKDANEMIEKMVDKNTDS